MNTEQLFDLLGALSGHLVAESPQDQKQLKRLHQVLARTALPEDARELKTTRFAFESADVFAPEKISPPRAASLRAVAKKASTRKTEAEYRVFMREMPLRDASLYGSVPAWANGAAVQQTIGPFTHLDGREYWFDFYKIEKLVALYLQGSPEPVMLFKIGTNIRFVHNHLIPVRMTRSYKLRGDIVWIHSRLLAPNAPANFYTGLTIKGGTISFSAPPQIVGDKFTVAPHTNIAVNLNLRQPNVSGADPLSPYGVDARAAELDLPDTLAFHFTAQGRTFDEISDMQWSVYGHQASFQFQPQQPPTYDAALQRVLIPFACSENNFQVSDNQSPFHSLRGDAPITASAWALPAAPIDVANPSPAAGIGGILVRCGKGLASAWSGLQDGDLNLNQPYLLADVGSILLGETSAGNVFGKQEFDLWTDEQNPHGSKLQLQIPSATPLLYLSLAKGNEGVSVLAHADVQSDRPVTVSASALEIRSKNSLVLLSVGKTKKHIYLFDDNMLQDIIDPTQKPLVLPQPISLALHNALFKTTPVSGLFLWGNLADDFVKVTKANLYLTFGLLAYIPTLPDPYAANLSGLRFQFRGSATRSVSSSATVAWATLICNIKWKPLEPQQDDVKVSFQLAPLPAQTQTSTPNAQLARGMVMNHANVSVNSATLHQTHPLFTKFGAHDLTHVDAPSQGRAQSTDAPPDNFNAPLLALQADVPGDEPLPNYRAIWDEATNFLRNELFALLDVSTNADLLGVSFNFFYNRRMAMQRTHNAVHVSDATANEFPLQVQGMDVVSQARNVNVFTVPQVSWEPVVNLTAPDIAGDPQQGYNYYPDDGGPTRIVNNSAQHVALAPIPLTDFLALAFKSNDQFAAAALFGLPFGLAALALLQNKYNAGTGDRPGSTFTIDPKTFGAAPEQFVGARALQLRGGEALRKGESDMFMGSTVQINNVLRFDGSAQGESTLGRTVTEIFNREFLLDPFELIRDRGVPLTRIDLSGYGASSFSNWLNPKATIAETSQAKFDMFVGRTAHEIIQVKSILYPWAIKVVRTITLWRVASGYVYRYDSGWRAESDGKFDFRYYVYVPDPADPAKLIPSERFANYEIHRGVISRLTNIKDIRETDLITRPKGKMAIKPGEKYVDKNGKELTNTTPSNIDFEFELQPVYFDADVEIENPVSGYVTKNINDIEVQVAPGKRILGFVQVAPRGIPITVQTFRDLILTQAGSIGGAFNVVINIANSGQQMRLHRFDVSNSFAANGSDPIFVAAARGSVILPKDGSWSMVKHENGTGQVSPVPSDYAVSLIRIGKIVPAGDDVTVNPAPAQELVRIADPTELLRAPIAQTTNYGFLLSTDTQKALFLTPAFRQNVKQLLTKTPPLFVDAFRIANSKAIFPNIGNAVTDFGQAISLYQNANEFVQNAFTDGGKNVLQVMNILDEAGYALAKANPLKAFDLPNKEFPLIDIGAFKIYLEYKADNAQKIGFKDGNGNPILENRAGALDFNLDSAAGAVADRWKSKMANVGIVVDLGPIKRLMTIKANWDAKNGSEAAYKGNDADPTFPSPQIEFAKELQPVIDILQILQDLQGENYKEAIQNGLKLAMSNKAGSWEYKLEASKEIPVVRFPMPMFLYNDPNAPFKLEAGLKLGVFFNAALKVTTDAKQLLPTAGGYLGFYGRLSVMCVSLSIATVYAIGQVNLDIAASTAVGPSLRMKFGFGAQIVVGLPVVGNVSVMYVVGVEIYTDKTKVVVSAFLLFQGHAELLGGIIGVTITIEAKGTVARITSPEERTDLAAQVTFAIEISLFLVIDISFSTSWSESRQIA